MLTAMPIVIQGSRHFIGLMGLAVNSELNYPNYFVMIPSGPDAKTAFTRGFLDEFLSQNPRPQTAAIVGPTRSSRGMWRLSARAS
jgi:branched-chain amino acid transport system substrate-binding protein